MLRQIGSSSALVGNNKKLIYPTSRKLTHPRQQDVLLRQAEKHIRRGRLRRAIDCYRTMVAEDPRDLASLNRIGDLLMRTAQVDKAIDIFLQVARHYAEDGFLTKAMAIYRKVLRCDPLQEEARCRLVDLYRRRQLPVPLFSGFE